jgi:hypothetical protein
LLVRLGLLPRKSVWEAHGKHVERRSDGDRRLLGDTVVARASYRCVGLTILGFVGLKSTAIGERWLDHYFQRKIAAFKHEQDKGIEGLKADLAHLGDRGRRANEREFDALSGIWDAFVDAFLKTNQAVISYRSFPDLDRLLAEDLAATTSDSQ